MNYLSFVKKRVKVLGLSDSFNLCGALEFSENISKSGTQPILGTQVNFKYKDIIGKVPLIAKSEIGYKSIIQLSSKSFIENDNLDVPHCDIEELLSLSGDIIVLSGSLNGLTGKLFEKDKISEIEDLYNLLKKKFKNDFYIEIQRHNDFNEKNFENLNLKLSEELKIPIIATNEVYYLEKEMHEAHDALMCIGNKTNINDQNRKKLSDQHYLKNDNELEKLFYDLPEALENNYNLVYKINFRPKASKPVLPNIGSEKGLDPKNILLEESITGLKNKIKETFNINENNIDKNEIYQKYLKRLDHEINIIIKMEYSSYFLIVSDYIKWAKANNIPVGPGRGSGAGSLVAWCLDITDVDPIKFNLIFERFLNPDRISMPDFDIDFCEEKRDLVFEYLNTKYKNSVAHIITFGKLKARMVIRDVGRVLGFSYGFVDSISKMIPFDPSRPQSLTECINNEPRLQKIIKDDTRVKKLIELSLKLEGLNRNFATHAAGVVIADKKLTDTVPLYKDNSSNLLLPSTQFDMYSAENAGLIKFDFLGLKTLTVINNTSKMIKENKNFDIKKINFDDQKVFKLLSSGHTVGLFQLESSGMREALMQMKPNHLEDIIALVALYRPGPMANIPTYNDCKHGNKEPDYLHPLLEEILKPTYGVIIYQEQVMQIAQKLSGFTAGEADILRRAMGKKKRQELEKQKLRFIEGAVKNGINRETAASIFLKIEPFAEYGFNKSHAAAYAIIAYQTAFLKTYYQKEFFSASMTMDISNQNKLSEFYEELKRLKIKIQRPDINKCFADFKSKNDIFYYALGAIKNVGYEAVSNIVKERLKGGEFSSLNNFINRINPKDINKLQLEGLVKAGAFDSININRKKLYDSIPKLILKSKNTYDNKINNQINLFQTDDEDDDVLENNPDDWKFDERLSKEFSSIGFFVSDHPLNEFSEILENYKVYNFNDFKDNMDKLEANIAATVLKIQEKKTQKGNSYAIVKFSDRQSVFELFIFSDLLEINREFLKEGYSLLITVNKNISDENNRFKKYNVRKISPLQNLINKPIENILISVHTEENLKEIDKILHKQGNTNVKIKFISETKELVFNLKNKRHIDRNHINLLRNQGISTNII